MKKLMAITAACLILLSGCTKQETDNSQKTEAKPTNAAETTPNNTDLPEKNLSEEEQRKYMIEHSFITEGDTSRMVRVLKKAANGEEITVGFIGGSITEGLTAGAEQCYAKLTYDSLCQMFPNTKINYVNAGLSGTPSILGVVRAERDLFGDKKPDIIFIEFAVNDGQTQMYKDCYESLVRKSLNKDNDPAVVLLFTVLQNRFSCQPQMSEIGKYYKLPMISVGNAINPMFDAGLMTWEKYSDDQSHPNVWGHELVKDFIMSYFEKVKELAEKTEDIPDASDVPASPLESSDYENIKIVEAKDLNITASDQFKQSEKIVATFGGYMYRGADGASLSFTAEFKHLFLIFHCNKSDKFADARVFVDGEEVISLPSNKTGGWGNPEADLAWTGDKSEQHTVEIKIDSSDSMKYYGFLGIGTD